MSAEIVNLRKVRKQRERDAKEARAEENRTKFGVSKTERRETEVEAQREAKRLDGHWLKDDAIDRPLSDNCGSPDSDRDKT